MQDDRDESATENSTPDDENLVMQDEADAPESDPEPPVEPAVQPEPETEDTAEVPEASDQSEESEDSEEAGESDGTASDDDDGSDEDEEDEEEGEEGDEEEGQEQALPIASVVEAILFAAREPLKINHIARAVGKRTRHDAVKAAIDELNVHYLETSRAFEIAEISGKYQLMSRPEYVRHIVRIYPKRELSEKERGNKLTPAALDTLSIIAYKQPVTRGEIEHIRGVGCGPVLRALIERGSVKVAGKRVDLVGQPLMYGTTDAFLAEFGLGSLEELPLRSEFLAMAEEFAPTPEPDLTIVPSDEPVPEEPDSSEEPEQPEEAEESAEIPEPEPETPPDSEETTPLA